MYIGQANTLHGWSDSAVNLPIVGAVNPWLLIGGLGLLGITLFSGEGKSYSKAKTARIRSRIHGARMTSSSKRVDAAKRSLRAAEKRLEALEAS